MAEALDMAFVEHSHDSEILFAALHAETHIVHQSQGRVGGGGQGLVEECVDLVVVLAQDLTVVGVCGHPLQSVDEDFDGGADVIVLVKGGNAVLLALLHQIGRGRPGGRAFGELPGLDAVRLGEGFFVERPGLFLHFKALPYGRFQAGRVEIHVCDRGEEAFQKEDVHCLVLDAQVPRLVGEEGETFEAVQQVVL